MIGPILIIEDDPDIAEVLKYCLEKEEFSTRVALTGEDGLAASLDRLNPPSIILLDLLLPGMNGIEICRRLRREEMTVRTPVIVITAKEYYGKLLQLSVDDYIVKPFAVRDVITRVRSLLRRQSTPSN
jgi:DNA-binding response OmpR family regulator